MITIFRSTGERSWWNRRVVHEVPCIGLALEWVDAQPKEGYIFHLREPGGNYRRVYRNRRQAYVNRV